MINKKFIKIFVYFYTIPFFYRLIITIHITKSPLCVILLNKA